MLLSDFPKIHCPFVRKLYSVNKEDFDKYGSQFQLRKPEVFLVTPQINPGYEWVFEDPKTIAVEKLNGCNVKILVDEQGTLLQVQNRKNLIDVNLNMFNLKGKYEFLEGLLIASDKGNIKTGEQCGELLGPRVQGNPYGLIRHEWYPFLTKSIESLKYKSFHKYERTYENWSSWFKDYLFSLYYRKRRPKDKEEDIFAEGIVFYNFKRKEQGLTYRAKLRRDMFDWFYRDYIRLENQKEQEI